MAPTDRATLRPCTAGSQTARAPPGRCPSDRVPLDPSFGTLVSAIVVLEGVGRQLVSGAFPSCVRSLLAEIYLGHTWSCQAIEHTPWQDPGLDLFALALPMVARQAAASALLGA